MILTGSEIAKNVAEKKITIDKYDARQVNPNSYDLRLGPSLLTYKDRVLDTKEENPTFQRKIDSGGTLLKAGVLYLGSSKEAVGSEYFVPVLHAKSGVARLGLFVHATADLIDLGYKGQLTFQLIPTVDVIVYSGMRIAQLSFWLPLGNITLYSGKYQGSKGPQKSRINKNL